MSSDRTGKATDDEQAAQDKVDAGGDKLQAQSEQKLAEMSGNAQLADSAAHDGADAEKRAQDAAG